jgi:hypothetical protein
MLGGIRLLPELWVADEGVFLFRLERPADCFQLKIGDIVNLGT